MTQEFKQREIYEPVIQTAWDLWDRNLNSFRSMRRQMKQREIYETRI